MANTLDIACISWIDQAPLPKVGFWLVVGAATSWPKRVIMGLVGTSNPSPPVKIDKLSVFAAGKQYRALLACTVNVNPPVRTVGDLVDPGYTPPFDKTKIDTSLRSVAPIPDDPAFYAGEKSPISGIVTGRLHPCSTLSVSKGSQVLVSGLIKFRAGPHTDAIGVKEAKSPVHVPWVWSEFALVSVGGKLRLLGKGSAFPSHAWYVNGKQVAQVLQALVTASEHDPILSTGQPADQVQSKASVDKSTQPVDKHAEGMSAGKLIDVPVSA